MSEVFNLEAHSNGALKRCSGCVMPEELGR